MQLISLLLPMISAAKLAIILQIFVSKKTRLLTHSLLMYEYIVPKNHALSC